MNAVTVLLIGFLGVAAPASAETVDVKYRGPVDLKTFACATVMRSSLVWRVCYDQREQYMIIDLRGTYYPTTAKSTHARCGPYWAPVRWGATTTAALKAISIAAQEGCPHINSVCWYPTASRLT